MKPRQGWIWAVIALCSCGPPAFRGVPLASQPSPGTVDALELSSTAGLPEHAVRRFGSSRVSSEDMEPTLHWLDERHLVVIDSGTWDPLVVARIWEVPTGRMLWFQPLQRHGGPMGDYRTWELDRQHHRLALYWDELRVVDLKTRRVLWRRAIPDETVFWPRPMLLTPDGKTVLAAEGRRSLGVWSLADGQPGQQVISAPMLLRTAA